MKITVKAGKKDYELQLSDSATVKDLKVSFSKESKKSINRLSFKKEHERLDDDSKTLSQYGIENGATLHFKDLGPQIGYRTVFLVEYFGPMLFVLLYALRPSLIYGANASMEYSRVGFLGVVCWVAHFMKREFETIFVHKFSRPTMPLNNLFKNCAYYWLFGLAIGYPLCSPSFVGPVSQLQVNIGLAIFILSELGNLQCHVYLSGLRAAEGSKKRPIPKGLLFDYVACPNYTFEILSWVGFSIMTNILFSYLFTLVGFLQMADWALKKHKEYKKTYDKEYTSLNRKAMVPFLL